VEKQRPAASFWKPSNGAFRVIDEELAPNEARVINFQPTSGKAGSTFVVQGPHFVGTTAISAKAFTVQ
jgi:hypothetical protein